MGNLTSTPAEEESRRRDVQSEAVASGTIAAGAAMIVNQQQQFNQSTRLLQETNDRLKKRRGPVQPDMNSDLAKEQSRIRHLIERNALFIQIVLFLVFLCAIAYLVLPLNIANYTALAILSIALIYRIFFVE